MIKKGERRFKSKRRKALENDMNIKTEGK